MVYCFTIHFNPHKLSHQYGCLCESKHILTEIYYSHLLHTLHITYWELNCYLCILRMWKLPITGPLQLYVTFWYTVKIEVAQLMHRDFWHSALLLIASSCQVVNSISVPQLSFLVSKVFQGQVQSQFWRTLPLLTMQESRRASEWPWI